MARGLAKAGRIRPMQVRREHSETMGRYQRAGDGAPLLAWNRDGWLGWAWRNVPRSARRVVVVERWSAEGRKCAANSISPEARRIRSARHESRSGELLSVSRAGGRRISVFSRLSPPRRICIRPPARWTFPRGTDRSLEHDNHRRPKRIWQESGTETSRRALSGGPIPKSLSTIMIRGEERRV